MGDKITLNDAAIKEKGLKQTHFTVVDLSIHQNILIIHPGEPQRSGLER